MTLEMISTMAHRVAILSALINVVGLMGDTALSTTEKMLLVIIVYVGVYVGMAAFLWAGDKLFGVSPDSS